MPESSTKNVQVTAEGEYKWLAVFVDCKISIDLTFPSHGKRHFSGTFSGDALGGADGLCTYEGDVVPEVGDTWDFQITAAAGLAGYALVIFNPSNGPYATVRGPAAGGGSAGPLAVGRGTWS